MNPATPVCHQQSIAINTHTQTATITGPEGASELVRGLLGQLGVKSISIGDLFNQLDHRSFGAIIVLLSLIGLVPGVSVLAGLCILILSVQIIRGNQTLSLPVFVASRELDVDRLRKRMDRPLYYITQLEKLIKPRYPLLLLPLFTRFTGLVVFCLALIMISPLPLSNILPAIALLQISLGLLESDGLAILCGWISSVIAIAVGVFMIFAAIEFTTWFLSR